jgi:ABC-type sulfate transport system substrate-binding protein
MAEWLIWRLGAMPRKNGVLMHKRPNLLASFIKMYPCSPKVGAMPPPSSCSATFESEVVSVDREFGTGKVDAVHPSISIVAENPIAVVERTVAKKGTGELAKAYLDYLYSEEAQEIAAKHALRPRNAAVLKKYSATFKPIQLFTVNELFGSLAEAQKVHFNDGGQFDKIYTVK